MSRCRVHRGVLAALVGQLVIASPVALAASPTVSPPQTPTTIDTPTPTLSSSPTPRPTPPPVHATAISLSLPGAIPAGAGITATARLTSEGRGLPGYPLQYQVDGVHISAPITGGDGQVTVEIRRDLDPGSHTVGFAFAGDPGRGFQPSSAQGSLVVLPPAGTSIGLSLPSGRRTGEAIGVEASIYQEDRPLPGALLHVAVAEHQVALLSDGSGHVRYELPRTLSAGTHPVSVEYHGDRAGGLLGATATGSLTVLPALRTFVSLNLPPPTKAGHEAEISGVLSSETGVLPARTPLHLLIDGNPKTTLQTDGVGSVHFKLPRNLPLGTHDITLAYHGDEPAGIAPSSASGTLPITSLEVRLQTVPALAGVTFNLDDRDYQTGPSGTVAVGVDNAGSHRVAARPPADQPDAHIRFAHWFDQEKNPERTLRVFTDETVHAAFSGSYLTPISFRDAGGRPLDPSRLDGLQVRGPGGRVVGLQPGQSAAWLDMPPPSRVSLLGLGPGPRYTVEAARFDGVSVANRGDAAFAPGPGRHWNARLRVYTLQVKVRRPLLGSGVRELFVTSPAGARRVLRPGVTGSVTLSQLPRGLYAVEAVGDSVAPVTAVQMTRDQIVDLSSFTPPEVAVGAALLLFTLGGLAAGGLALRWRHPGSARRLS